MDRFYHHSRQLAYREPQGAAPCGSRVRIAAEVGGRFAAASIRLRLWQEGAGETLLPMQIADGIAETALTLPDASCLLWYHFIIELPDGARLWYGGRSGAGALSEHEPSSFRITVYDGAYRTPAWFTEGVCYQIFPDRFFRSSWEDFHARLGAHIALGRHPRVHERWSEAPCFTPAPGQTEYAPDDYFGGDLNGIRQKLDYIASFGVTCIYLNPICAAASNHRYNTANYRSIDPLLGTDEDFRLLCSEAKRRGIRIMLDGVFSHTGSDSIYFNREGHYGETTGAYRDPQSPYRSWYTFTDAPAKDGTNYDCWWGFPTLPNVNELNPSYVEYIAGENGVLSHYAALGATDWRLDVADELPDEFIRILRRRVKANDPDAVLLGEVWDEPTEKRGAEGRRGYVNGDELDSVMNYCFTNATIAFLTGRMSAEAYADALAFLREQYPKPFYDAALNLLSSHDVERAATALSGAPSRYTLTREAQAAFRPTPENAAKGRARLILGTAIQTALPGVPCLYYGDEAGLTGMGDPFNRAPFPWGGEDAALTDAIRSLLTLRKKSSALRHGRCRMGAPADNVFAIVRYTEADAAILIVNRGEAETQVKLTRDALPEGPDGRDALPLDGRYTDQNGVVVTANGEFSAVLPPLCAKMYIRGVE